MGGDKPQRLFRGRPLLVHAAERLQDLCDELLVVGGGSEMDFWLKTELPAAGWVPDLLPGLGPLAGLQAGLRAASSPWCLCLAADHPFVTPAVLRLLLACREGFEAVVPRAEGRLQPLTAAYSAACAGPLEESLRSGERSASRAVGRLLARILEEDELRRVDPDLHSFVNLNTLADLDRWE